MAWQLETQFIVGNGQADQWWMLDHIFVSRWLIIKIDGPEIPNTWETVGYAIPAYLFNNDNLAGIDESFVIAGPSIDNRYRLLPKQPQELIAPFSQGEAYKLWFRFVRYMRTATIAIYSNDENPPYNGGNGGTGVVNWADIQGDKLYSDLVGLPDLSIYALASQLPDLSPYALIWQLPTIPGNVSAFTNDAGYLTTISGQDYETLANKPNLGIYALSSALNNYLLTSNFTWVNLGGKPSLFSGNYDDLTNRPTIPTLTGWEFDFTVSGWTANSSIFVAHGLGQKPAIWLISFVATVANNGYSVGDEVIPRDYFDGSSAHIGFSVIADSTNLRISLSSAVIPTKTGVGPAVTALPSQWDIRFRAATAIPASGSGSGSTPSWTTLGSSIAIVNSTTTTIPHNLGSAIQEARLIGVCIAANNGYFVGETVILSPSFGSDENTISWDSSNVYFRRGDGSMRISNSGTGTITIPHNSWKAYVQVR